MNIEMLKVEEHGITAKFQKIALITGITGQDASYLAESLLEKDYKVVGVKRRTSSPNYENISSFLDNPNFKIVTGDITDYVSVSGLVNEHKPDEIYNLAAQSFVKASFDQPIHTFDVDTIGVLNFLEVIRNSDRKDQIKFYQASTSEMFGRMYSMEQEYDQYTVVEHFDRNKITPKELWAGCGVFHTPEQRKEKLDWFEQQEKAHIDYPDIYGDVFRPVAFQNEETPFVPQSPYGIAKLAAHHLVRLYRESYEIKAACGILFNHESPRRGKEFVTRKITDYIGRLVNECSIRGSGNGNYTIGPDGRYGISGYTGCTAKEIEQESVSGEFFYYTGISPYSWIPHKARNFPKLALGNLDAVRDWGHAKDFVEAQYLILQQDKMDDFVICTGESHTVKEFCDIAFKKVGLDYRDFVVVDPKFYRPAEVDFLHGDSSKARNTLGWKPNFSFAQLVEDMVTSDVRRYQ